MDIEGGDGILYILVLPGASGKIDPKITVAHANEMATQMGINVKVKIFQGSPDDFNPAFLDETDNYVVIGGTSKELENFVADKGIYRSGAIDGFFIENNRFVERMEPLGITGEKISGVSDSRQKIGLITLATLERSINQFSDKPSLEKLAGFSALHEAGHNETNIIHDADDPDIGFMSPGDELTRHPLQSTVNDDLNNEIPVELWNRNMQGHLNRDPYTPIDRTLYRTPTDNYEAKKASANKKKP